MRRAAVNATAAAHTGEHTIIIGREICKLVHKALTEPLHLTVTVVAVSHHGKIGVHTAVPAAISLNTISGVVILDVITLTGGANKCTGSASKTGLV
jgi:hypothetical protein